MNQALTPEVLQHISVSKHKTQHIILTNSKAKLDRVQSTTQG